MKIDTKFIKFIILCVVVIVAIIAVAIVFLTFAKGGDNSTSTPEIATTSHELMPLEIIKAFKFVSLEYGYRNVVYEHIEEARKLLFIKLPPGTKSVAVSYNGKMSIGIDASKIEVTQKYQTADGKNVLSIILPDAQIISHEEDKDSYQVLFDDATKTEHLTTEEYLSAFAEEKTKIEKEVVTDGLLDQAKENAREQLAAFLNAIPSFTQQYTIEWVD